MNLRNLPTESAAALAALIETHPGHVSSMALSKGGGCALTLLAFAAGESVSEERYFGDTLYYLVEGSAVVVLPERRVQLREGEVLMVPARVEHALEGCEGCGFKVLQITVEE